MTRYLFAYSPGFTILFFIALFAPSISRAQTEQCGTVPFNNRPGKGEESKQDFEQWMQAKLAAKHGLSQVFRTDANGPVYTIPVVVHVIHKGEAVGTGSNISDEQILDQVRILNEDFRRQNPDTVNTPDNFKPVAADTKIEFVLARQDPDGFPSNGIVRVQGNRETYNLNSASTLSELSYWPAELYMNIWVAPLEPGLLGYASFPVSDLPGLENTPDNPSTDGIVISYKYFGSIGNVSSQSEGRTTTHEAGHFLGLRHIWGDDGGDCSIDDYVEDTPLQGPETNSCPEEKSTCGSVDMFQNYMDYTNDACMNIFTQDQKDRMRIVLENSIRRESLLTSPGLSPPALADNDAGIRKIVSPAPSECDGMIIPEITVFNAGELTLNSFSVSLYLQGNLIEEVQGTSKLETGESTHVTFTELDLSQGTNTTATYDLRFAVTGANDTVDENPVNNQKSLDFIIPQQDSLPVSENFENPDNSSFLDKVLIRNPDNSITWEITEAPGFGENNHALYMNFYEYENAFGEKDALYTPTYDFSSLTSATLSFKIAYVPYLDKQANETSSDGLRIGVSLDCGATINTLLYDLAGEELATGPPSEALFIPENRTDWRTVELSLDAFTGEPNVQLAFIAVNDYGNNLYLDDIRIEAKVKRNLDLAIIRVNSPTLLSCEDNPSPLITIKNQGQETIHHFDVTYQVDNQPSASFAYNASPLAAGEEKEIPLEQIDLATGLHSLFISATNPNQEMDEQPEDNQKMKHFFVDDNRDLIPLINDFQTSSLPDVLAGEMPADSESWLVVNPDSSITWRVVNIPGSTNGRAAGIENFVNENIGSRDRLVSPTLDFSYTLTASVFFKVSYALLSENYVDTLRVLASADCGQSYTTVYEKAGSDIAVTETEEEWIPSQPADWIEEFIDLSDFAGETDVRLAFEVINGYGNNLYLDDIEFFLSDDPDPLILEEDSYRLYPNPTDGLFKATFNLQERETIYIALYDIRGSLLFEKELPFTLNQTYEFDLSAQPAGVYILSVKSPSINDSQRIIVY